ncbi:MAG: AAA family ATPase [Hyphomonadaceae bacterium]|nr:AAA family ATPase [Hyphomonadaceae bacterium]
MTKRTRDALRYTEAGAYDDDAPTFDFIPGLLHDGTVAFVYGPPGSGKTFFILHLLCSTALGRPVFGVTPEKRRGLYIGLEGDAGIKSRIAAWCDQNGVDENPIVYARGPFNLADESGQDVGDLIDYMKKHCIQFVVLDTFAMATAGLDEVSGAHMTFAMNQLHRIKTETGACVVAIAHTGKNEKAGIRGHSSLLGNADTTIELQVHAKDASAPEDVPVTNETPRSATVKKQRDGRTGKKLYFGLIDRATPFRNARGETVTSLAVNENERFTDLGAEQESARLPAGVDALALETLEAMRRRNRRLELPITRDDLRDALKREGWKRNSKSEDAWERGARRLIASLTQAGLWEESFQ